MWHALSSADRILSWRSWRLQLDDMPVSIALESVAKAWMMVPRVNHYLSPDDIHAWPTPWQLINDNMYCDLSVALGMFYSLQLSRHSAQHAFSIDIYQDHSGWINLCSMDGGLSILNCYQGMIVNTPTLPSAAKLRFSYNQVDLADKLG